MNRSVVVIGAGQAGLSVSLRLRAVGVEHVVLERHNVAQAWRDRWASFTLVTPNWTLDLPGHPYDGIDPEGHVARDEIVAYLESCAQQAGEIRTGVHVDRLTPGHSGRLLMETSDGPLEADDVVVCTGAYQRPHRPKTVDDLPRDLLVLDATGYDRPDDLPPGDVLVIGSGQTGAQLAEELFRYGRGVTLACGRAPWLPRRVGDLDIVTWLSRCGFYDQPRSALASPADRLVANFQATGAGGGRDLHFRTLQTLGVRLAGRLIGVSGHRAAFADDLAASVAFGDARYAAVRTLLTQQFEVLPDLPDPPPFRADPVSEVDLRGFGAVIVTSGFRPDYTRWVEFPVFDELGFPVVDDELRTQVEGLFFCGVHFLRNRRSSLLFGVGDDAGIVATQIAARAG